VSSVSLANFAGRKLVLYFWPRADTGRGTVRATFLIGPDQRIACAAEDVSRKLSVAWHAQQILEPPKISKLFETSSLGHGCAKPLT
jgi:peroxiredoxin